MEDLQYKTLTPHLPKQISESHFPQNIEYVGDHANLYKIIDDWRTRPGELIPLEIPKDPVNLKETLQQTVVVSEVPQNEDPTKSIEDLKSLKTVSINMNALGGPGQDSFYRKEVIPHPGHPDYDQYRKVMENERQLIAFLTEEVGDAAVVTLQDVPIYLMRFLGPQLNKLGYSYYANVYGSNGGGEGHMASNVTLINTHALEGYSIEDASLSITPHMQGTRKVVDEDGNVTYEYGSHQAEIEDIEQNYGKSPSGEDATRNAYQTFNTKLTVRGTDGTRDLIIGNTYMSPWSLMMERSKSVALAMANMTKLQSSLFQKVLKIMQGDLNLYGTDTSAESKNPAYPRQIIHSILRKADKGENRHINKVGESQGYTHSDNTEPTITKAGGLVGLQVDKSFVSTGDGLPVAVHAEPPESVSFTDHRPLVSEITFQ